MKHLSKQFLPFLFAFIAVLFFAQCKNKSMDAGYTGELTNPKSVALSQVYHFIEKDSIDKWTERYKMYKDSISGNHLPGTNGSVLQDSSSFYNTIIRKIIGNENSIGLRVLNGMDAEKKVHTIFVGINPDYTSLYIPEPIELQSKGEKKQANLIKDLSPMAQVPGVRTVGLTGKIGGAEYGTMP